MWRLLICAVYKLWLTFEMSVTTAMISFTFRLSSGENVKAAFEIGTGTILVHYEGTIKSAPIGADAKATVQIRNDLLRAIMIEQAMEQPVAK